MIDCLIKVQDEIRDVVEEAPKYFAMSCSPLGVEGAPPGIHKAADAKAGGRSRLLPLHSMVVVVVAVVVPIVAVVVAVVAVTVVMTVRRVVMRIFVVVIMVLMGVCMGVCVCVALVRCRSRLAVIAVCMPLQVVTMHALPLARYNF